MLQWIKNVWTQRNALNNLRFLLVLNSFRRHLIESVKNRFNEKQTNIAVIPDRFTSKLQPLDIAINKSFKVNLHQYYNDWMNSKVCELTLSEKIKKPLYANVTSWVKRSQNDIDINLIKKSFKCCDISVARDDSEDNLVFDYNGLKNKKSKKTKQIIDVNNEEN